jgi:hypothetical protein
MFAVVLRRVKPDRFRQQDPDHVIDSPTIIEDSSNA